MSVWPLVLSLIAGVAVLTVLVLVFVGSERLTRRLTRNWTPRSEDSSGTGGGEVFGEAGLIARGRGDDLYPRDRDR